MDVPWLAAALVAGVIALTPLADVVRVPQPVLLTLYGLGLGLLPHTHGLTLEPDLILPVVLPPLLFAATQRTSSTEFREHAGAVLALAVGLTVSTAAAVAVVGHAVGLGWATAWVLGAIVSPPDPVAATAVARRLRLPHRLVTILEGEGMFNDATALVLFKVTLVTVVAGSFSLPGTALAFVLTIVVGTVVGLTVGAATRLLLTRIEDGYTETTITVVVPFLAYLLAERLEGSGVLAVLVLGLHLRNVGHEATTSFGWLLGRSVWAYADFLITSLAFAVLGYELIEVITATPLTHEGVVLSGAVLATVVLFRAAWIFPVAWVARLRARRRDAPLPADWRETTVVAWSGMRGVVTVATALALPATVDAGGRFPDHDLLVLAALVCVLATLVVQGLTLAPLTARLGVSGAGDDGEVVALRSRAAGAALDFVRDYRETPVAEEVRRAATQQYTGYLDAQQAMDEARRLDHDAGSDPAGQLDTLLRLATDVERRLVLDARRRGEVSAESADEVLRDIERRALRDVG